jgi:hypothetical protein
MYAVEAVLDVRSRSIAEICSNEPPSGPELIMEAHEFAILVGGPAGDPENG